MVLAAGMLLAQDVIAQPEYLAGDTLSRPIQPPIVAVSGIDRGSAAGTGAIPVATAPPKKYSALLARERSTMGVMADAVLDFYPGDEFLRILPGSPRSQIVAAPFNMRAKNAGTSLPGVPSATTAHLYQTDSSLGSLVDWYSREYGFDFVITHARFNESAGDTLTVARAVKRFDNALVTLMIWNPTSTPKGRKGKSIAISSKTSVEVQERFFRPRGELIVEGPDAMVELTWNVPYQDLIQKVSIKYQIDPHLLAALVQQESNFNADAISVDSAQGLTQMIPGTAEMLGVTNPYDPAQSIDGGARYLKILLKRFQGNVEFALAGYNAGPGNVDKYRGIPPFAETRNYVRRIMERYREKAAGRFAPTAQVIKKS